MSDVIYYKDQEIPVLEIRKNNEKITALMIRERQVLQVVFLFQYAGLQNKINREEYHQKISLVLNRLPAIENLTFYVDKHNLPKSNELRKLHFVTATYTIFPKKRRLLGQTRETAPQLLWKQIIEEAYEKGYLSWKNIIRNKFGLEIKPLDIKQSLLWIESRFGFSRSHPARLDYRYLIFDEKELPWETTFSEDVPRLFERPRKSAFFLPQFERRQESLDRISEDADFRDIQIISQLGYQVELPAQRRLSIPLLTPKKRQVEKKVKLLSVIKLFGWNGEQLKLNSNKLQAKHNVCEVKEYRELLPSLLKRSNFYSYGQLGWLCDLENYPQYLPLL